MVADGETEAAKNPRNERSNAIPLFIEGPGKKDRLHFSEANRSESVRIFLNASACVMGVPGVRF